MWFCDFALAADCRLTRLLTSYGFAPTNSQKLPIRIIALQALAAIGLSTISTTLLFASLFEDDIACPYTFIVVWMEA